MKRFLRAMLMRIDKNCSWCDGSGYWNGKPCINCNPVEIDPDDQY